MRARTGVIWVIVSSPRFDAGEYAGEEGFPVALAAFSGVVSLPFQRGLELDRSAEVATRLAGALHAAVQLSRPRAEPVAEHPSVGLPSEFGHPVGLEVGGELGCLGVERVDLGADGGVLVSDDTIGDLGVGESHLHRAVPEEGGDGFKSHAAVDGLGGEGVTQLVRVHVADAGVTSHPPDDAGGQVSVDRAPVVGNQPAVLADVLDVVRRPGGKEMDQLRVQRHVAVVAKLADRDTKPMIVSDAHHGVGGEITELSSPETRPSEELDDQPIALIGLDGSSAHESGGVVVVEELRKGLRSWRDVPADDRVAGWSVGPVPLDDPLEEHAEHPKPLPLGVRRQRAVQAGLVGQPYLEVLDVVPPDQGDASDIRLIPSYAVEACV